jgi:hypothetical protein
MVLAFEIAQALSKAGLVEAKDTDELASKLSNGGVSGDDWKLLLTSQPESNPLEADVE